jgi:heme A synthase
LFRQILLTALVTLIVVLVVQARRRRARVDHSRETRAGLTPQAWAGWALLAIMLAAAVGTAFLHDGL